MKGIVLAGGNGSRLSPLTLTISKQLLPVYDKPMIYYPISTLMLAGIRSILIITRPNEQILFERLLGNGQQWGVEFQYAIQDYPLGVADALRVGEKFLAGDEVCLILGDNIFYGSGLGGQLSELRGINGAHIFGYHVSNPEKYGVIELDANNEPISLIEKPKNPSSNIAIPGLYFYANEACALVHTLKPSQRNEIEITDLNNIFLRKGLLNLTILGRGTFWMDAGDFDDLHSTATFIKSVEERQGLRIGDPMEIALTNQWVN